MYVCNASTRARLESHDDDNNDLQDEVRNVIVGSCGMDTGPGVCQE